MALFRLNRMRKIEIAQNGALIRMENVTKLYGKGAQASRALDGVTLTIDAGEFVSVMGPSGSGKTTLLNVIAGLDDVTGGRVLLGGRDLTRLKDNELADMRLQHVGFVFQSFYLLPAFTVEENVSWPLEFAGYRRKEVKERVLEALEQVGMEGKEKRYPGDLSGGEQQRVAIARALATWPSIILADEPTGNLDSKTGQRILDLLRRLNETRGVTVVMVTHNAYAATYGDRTIELHDGRVVRDIRTPKEEEEEIIEEAQEAAE